MSKIEFACSGCSACCRRVGGALANAEKAPEPYRTMLKEFPYKAKEDGSCEMLEGNKCKVYESRPDICSVDRMYKIVHQPKNESRKSVYLAEATACNSMIKEDGLDKKYLIDLKQYQ